MTIQLRRATLQDAAACAELYNPYIHNSVISFEEHPLTTEEMTQRMQQVLVGHPWWLAEEVDTVLGFAYAQAWKARPAYRHAVESSIYLALNQGGRGLGSSLYLRLLEDLCWRGYHTSIGGIALPNPASVALHEKLGFEKVAHFKAVGHKFGRWVDVGYWQKILPPFSKKFFLQSERLSWRTWQAGDLKMAQSLWGDLRVTQRFDARGAWSEREVQTRLEQEIQFQRQHGVQYWPVFIKDTERFIGAVGLRPAAVEEGLFELGFHLCPAAWGQGFAREAARSVIDYAFSTLGIRQLTAGHHPENLASQHILTQLAFAYSHDSFYTATGAEHPTYLLRAENHEASDRSP